MFNIEGLHESYDFEAKLAVGKDGKGKLPSSLWESYSAMANTDGGIILLGVEELKDGSLLAHHLVDTDGILKDFWNTIGNSEKISCNILSHKDVTVETVDGTKQIIQIRIPRARREQKPIYVGRNPLTGTYVRNGEGDYKCPEDLVKQMLAEQRNTTCDAELCQHFDMNDIDFDSFHAYRQLCRLVNPDHVFNSRDDFEFLWQIGGWTRNRHTNEEGLTIAGLLMFGKLRSILERFPNYILDYQERPRSVTEHRWIDRVTTDYTWPGNLFSFYQIVIKRLFADLKVPFTLQSSTMRVDNSPVHTAIREAFVNSLIHADYSGRCSILVVKRPDLFGFRNPGTLRVPKHIVIRGGNTDCRNRNLQKMFQLAGLAEQAGSGFPKIYDGWDSQSWRRPELDEKFDVPQTILALRMSSLLPDDAVAEASRELGPPFKRASKLERIAVVTAYSEGCVNHERMLEITQEHAADISAALHRLVENQMLEQTGRGRGTIYYPKGRKPQRMDLGIASPMQEVNSVSSNSVSSNSVSSNSVSSNSVSSNSVSSNSVRRDTEQWMALLYIAESARKNRKLSRPAMERIILTLCKNNYLTIEDLAVLLNRKPSTIRDTYINPLRKEGKIISKYPVSTHPDQRYQTDLSKIKSL